MQQPPSAIKGFLSFKEMPFPSIFTPPCPELFTDLLLAALGLLLGAGFPDAVTSLVAERALGAQAQRAWLMDLVVPRMWSLPRPEIEPMSPALGGGFLTTGKSLSFFQLDSLGNIYSVSNSSVSAQNGSAISASIPEPLNVDMYPEDKRNEVPPSFPTY